MLELKILHKFILLMLAVLPYSIIHGFEFSFLKHIEYAQQIHSGAFYFPVFGLVVFCVLYTCVLSTGVFLCSISESEAPVFFGNLACIAITLCGWFANLHAPIRTHYTVHHSWLGIMSLPPDPLVSTQFIICVIAVTVLFAVAIGKLLPWFISGMILPWIVGFFFATVIVMIPQLWNSLTGWHKFLMIAGLIMAVKLFFLIDGLPGGSSSQSRASKRCLNCGSKEHNYEHCPHYKG